MRKKLYNLFYSLVGLLLLASCEKDNITNSYFDEHPDRQEVVAEEARKVLASSEKGWVMMAKTSLSDDVYTPIVLKFDTAKNLVHIKTVYGITADTESFFSIKSGTGSPQLIFTTGSIMSTLYRVGLQASDITDHIYNIVGVSADTVSIQCYRSGKVYAPEGGVTYKMFKRPDSWTWADDDILFDWTSDEFKQNVNAVVGEMKIDYLNSGTAETFQWRFWSWSDPTVYRIRDPFSVQYNIGTGGFKPMNYFIVTGDVIDNINTTVTMGQNAISIYPIPYNSGTNQSVVALAKNIKTHYLLFKNQTRSGDNVKMEFEAYGKNGEVILNATYDNLR